jgi:hypothetical protein
MNTLILTMFGDVVEWMPQYIENCNSVNGFKWLIFTDKDYVGGGNVEVIKMTMDEFQELFKSKLGKKMANISTEKFWDIRPAYGIIFSDYLKDSEYWGHTDHDCVYGDIPKFIGNLNCDIFTNDPYPTICGPFALWKNTDKVNNFYKNYPLWEDMLFGTDVHVHTRPLSGNLSPMSWTTKDSDLKIRYEFMQGNDKDYHRLEWKDGLFMDGDEIMMYHFRIGKQWPLPQ